MFCRCGRAVEKTKDLKSIACSCGSRLRVIRVGDVGRQVVGQSNSTKGFVYKNGVLKRA